MENDKVDQGRVGEMKKGKKKHKIWRHKFKLKGIVYSSVGNTVKGEHSQWYIL